METKDIIKNLRKKHGYTVKQVSSGAGISESVYPKYESGILNAGVPVLVKISDFYGVSVDYLLGREETPDPMAQLASLASMEITEQVILEKYLELPKASREIVINFMKSAIAEAEKRAKETQQVTDTTIKQKSTYTCGELEDMRKADQVAEQDAS